MPSTLTQLHTHFTLVHIQFWPHRAGSFVFCVLSFVFLCSALCCPSKCVCVCVLSVYALCTCVCVRSCVKRRFSRFSTADCQASVSSACVGHYKCCGTLCVCVCVGECVVASCMLLCVCSVACCKLLRCCVALTHHNYAQLHTKNAATTANGQQRQQHQKHSK